MTTNWINYFGFGSLVNRATRPPEESALSARLWGWQRVWNHRVTDPYRGQPCTSLNIEPLASRSAGSIEGVVVRMPAEALPDLDAREFGYERLALPASDFDLPDEFEGDIIMVYRSREENRHIASEEHPVLQSYVDCVMAGYLERFGQNGLYSLVSSTRGWDRPRLNDRDTPFYPRWVPVDEEQRQLFDHCLDQVDSRDHCA